MKDRGESVSELMIGKNNYKKLYTVLSCLGVFTFCTCFILICLACIVASFKLSCVGVVILCVFAVLCVYCCFVTLDAGMLARSQYSECPATGHFDTGFSWILLSKTNAEMVPKIPSCHYMLLR